MCRNTMRCVTELRWNTSARSTTTPTELCFRGRRTYRSSKFAASATVPNYNGTVIVISVLSGLRQRNNTYLGYRTGRWSNPGAEWCDTVTQVHTVDVGSLLFSLIFIHSFIHSFITPTNCTTTNRAWSLFYGVLALALRQWTAANSYSANNWQQFCYHRYIINWTFFTVPGTR